MADRISKERRSQIMSAIRSENTMPEVTLRKALWAKGLRFRVYYGKERPYSRMLRSGLSMSVRNRIISL
jgi:G:T-mismatch repair DNA endonuclease (very short patch repair protein)